MLFCSFFHYFSLFLSSSLSVLVKQLIPFQAHGGIEGAEALRLLSLSLSLSSSLLQLLLGDPHATPGSAASVIPPESPKSAAGTPRRWLERVILVVLFFQSLPKVHEHGSVWNMS